MGRREPLAHELVTAIDISLGEYLSSHYSFRSRSHPLALVVLKDRCAHPVCLRQRVCSGENPLISGVTAPGRGQDGKKMSPGGLFPGLVWWRWGESNSPFDPCHGCRSRVILGFSAGHLTEVVGGWCRLVSKSVSAWLLKPAVLEAGPFRVTASTGVREAGNSNTLSRCSFVCVRPCPSTLGSTLGSISIRGVRCSSVLHWYRLCPIDLESSHNQHAGALLSPLQIRRRQVAQALQ